LTFIAWKYSWLMKLAFLKRASWVAGSSPPPVMATELRCSTPDPPRPAVTMFRNTYFLNGRNPQKRRCSSTSGVMAAAALAGSHSALPRYTHECLAPPTVKSAEDMSTPARIGESARMS